MEVIFTQSRDFSSFHAFEQTLQIRAKVDLSNRVSPHAIEDGQSPIALPVLRMTVLDPFEA